MTASYKFVCAGCGAQAVSKRAHTRTCSPRCRRRLSRAKSKSVTPESLDDGQPVGMGVRLDDEAVNSLGGEGAASLEPAKHDTARRETSR